MSDETKQEQQAEAMWAAVYGATVAARVQAMEGDSPPSETAMFAIVRDAEFIANLSAQAYAELIHERGEDLKAVGR